MNRTDTLNPKLKRIQMISLVVGILGLAGAAGIFMMNGRQQFFQSYLYGFIFWIHVALGCFALVMLHHLVGGKWSFAARRFAESGAMTLPLMLLFFLPIAFVGLQDLYEWARPEALEHSVLLQHKEPYLNSSFFLGRAAFYFAFWIIWAFLLNKWSLEQDETGDPSLATRLKNMSALGMILYMVTATFAAYDWIMSLTPEWFSSIYGVIFIAGQALVTIAFIIIFSQIVAGKQTPPLNVYNDWGNFLLAFVSFWAYVSFSQYLIVWSANLPETIIWYLDRDSGGWQFVALALIFFHFAIPFLILLSRRMKRNVGILIALSIFLIFMRLVDFLWLMMPIWNESLFDVNFIGLVTAVVGIGGIWLAFFAWNLSGKSLLPLKDPRFKEVAAHE